MTDMKNFRTFSFSMLLLTLGLSATAAVNVMDFGAKGDGVADDTAAIQAAIDEVVRRGGGKVVIPYTPKGYRIAAPARELYNGRACRAQLVIPPGRANVFLEGEMPCKLLYSYQVRPKDVAKSHFEPTKFGTMGMPNTCLWSDWEAPEEHNPEARPWSLLGCVEGDSCAGRFSASQFSIANLEFRVRLDHEKMYPTLSACNLQNVARVNVRDSQFCLGDNVGDTYLGKELQSNPCHTVGLMTSGDQNDNQVLDNVAVQGFRYGFVLGEHTIASYLYVHNCEEGIVFHDSTHLSMINHVVAQHDTVVLATTRTRLFGHRKGICNIVVGGVDYEHGKGTLPVISRMKYGVYDEENRFRGSVTHHLGCPGNGSVFFPVHGAKNLKVAPLATAK